MATNTKRIVIVQGHPDPHGNHFGHALADTYVSAAEQAEHAIERIEVANLDFPLLRTQQDWEEGATPPSIKRSQEVIRWAEHMVLFYPLWHGTMPAVLKGFFEQLMRPGFALDYSNPNAMPKKLLKGRSARIVITMGMPAFLYRWYFRAHSLKSLERNILKFCGITPVRENLIGLVDGDAHKRQLWLKQMQTLGKQGT